MNDGATSLDVWLDNGGYAANTYYLHAPALTQLRRECDKYSLTVVADTFLQRLAYCW